MIITKADGTKWANNCALCGTTNRVGPMLGDEIECPWCAAVRFAHGDYFYPITDANRHLLEPPKPKPESQIQPSLADVRRVVREELAAASHPPITHPGHMAIIERKT